MPTYLMVTKWGTKQVANFGTVKGPACDIPGLTACQHLTGKAATDGDHILCTVDCDAATATKIEQQGVGISLWEIGKGEPDQAAIDAANVKLANYGLQVTIPPGAKGIDALVLIKGKIQGTEQTPKGETAVIKGK